MQKRAIIIANSRFENEPETNTPWMKNFSNFDSTKLTTAFEKLVQPAYIEILCNITLDDFKARFAETVKRDPYDQTEDEPLQVIFIYLFSHGSPNGLCFTNIDGVLPFDDVIKQVEAHVKGVPNKKLVIFFDCCGSGHFAGIQENLHNDVSVICSSNVRATASIYLPFIGLSVFGQAWCDICNYKTVSDVDGLKKAFTVKANRALQLSAESFQQQCDAIETTVEKMRQATAGTIAAINCPLLSGFLEQQMSLNNATAKYLRSVNYHMKTSREGNVSFEIYISSSDEEFRLWFLDIIPCHGFKNPPIAEAERARINGGGFPHRRFLS